MASRLGIVMWRESSVAFDACDLSAEGIACSNSKQKVLRLPTSGEAASDRHGSRVTRKATSSEASRLRAVIATH